MDELQALARQIGAELSGDKTTLVYNIIDKESELPAIVPEVEAPKKKRGRPSKAEIAAREAAAGNGNYNSLTRKATVTVKVR